MGLSKEKERNPGAVGGRLPYFFSLVWSLEILLFLKLNADEQLELLFGTRAVHLRPFG
ncbi:hypothetical protein LINPERHAP2_LOCUS35539 [Linum perenne]